MSQFRRLLKAIKISANQLSEAMGMPVRTLTHNYNSGRIPYALVYKIHKVTGASMEDIVPIALADSWLFLLDEQMRTNLPRGMQAQERTKRAEKRVEKWAQPSEEPKPVIPKKKKKVPRGTWPVNTEPMKEEIPDIPKSVTMPKQPKKSIADLMKSSPPPAPEEEAAPDFSKLSDDLFSTSADQTAGK